MAPRIAACTWFLEPGDRETIVADPEDLLKAVRGSAETDIVEGEHQP
jgi:carbamate kinase